MMKKVWMVAVVVAMVLVGVVAIVPPAVAQVTPMPFIVSQWFDNNGHPCSGCKLYTYAAGTTTPLGTFADALGSTPNANPVVLDSFGRANVFLSSSSYKFVLKTGGGTQFWSIDNITASNLSLLASNNTWTGTNTFNASTIFNGSAIFNVGLTSSGPNVLGGGGSLSGTWSGSPTFSGTPVFSNGISVTTLALSGQLTSTVTTGTAPFVIASTTQVNNLNAALLNGCTWAIPCAIGTTTPNTAVFTTLTANTSLTINGGTAQTGTQGTDTKLLTAGTVSGTSAILCTDAQGGATTVSCPTFSVTQIEAATISSPCTPPSGSSFDACSSTITWPHTFSDTSYVITCTAFGTAYDGGDSTTNSANLIYVKSQLAATASISIQNARGAQNTPTKVYCIAVHP